LWSLRHCSLQPMLYAKHIGYGHLGERVVRVGGRNWSR
jgi:hypothetical protein